MNIDKTLFNQITSNAKEMLGENIHPSSLTNPIYQIYAKEYSEKLLMDTYNCPREDYKTPEYILKNAFSAGVFCQILDTLPENENCEKVNFISSILCDNVFTTEGMMVGMLLVSDAEPIKDAYQNLQKSVVDESLNLTHQKNIILGENGSVKDNMTFIITMFLIGSSIKLEYKIT